MLDADGVPFVVGFHHRHLVPGLRIEVRSAFGREGLVAWNDMFEPGGC